MSQIPTHASYLADVARAAHHTGKDLTLEEVAAVIEAVNSLHAADDTVARTGNTARDQEMYAAGLEKGEENAKHNAAIRAAAPGVSTVEDKPAAYLTLDEEGSPCMLFFDVVEARTYCALGEEPEPLYRRPAPAAGDALDAITLPIAAARMIRREYLPSNPRRMSHVAVRDAVEKFLGALEAAEAAIAQQKGEA